MAALGKPGTCYRWWIISEDLPPLGEWVLVWACGHGCAFGRLLATGWNVEGHPDALVSGWMPMPQDPNLGDQAWGTKT